MGLSSIRQLQVMQGDSRTNNKGRRADTSYQMLTEPSLEPSQILVFMKAKKVDPVLS